MTLAKRIEASATRHEHRAQQLRQSPDPLDPHWTSIPIHIRINQHEQAATRLRALLKTIQ